MCSMYIQNGDRKRMECVAQEGGTYYSGPCKREKKMLALKNNVCVCIFCSEVNKKIQ